jgi:outer membrane receptor for ferrienterochelin and colicins
MNKNLNTVRKRFSVVNYTFASAMKAFLFVACILFSLSLFSQYSITGVVLENQQPLAGATIYHTPSKTGILTNSNGTFILSVPQKPKTIVVSFIGFEPQVIPVRFNDAFTADLGNITLVPDAALEEVVVSGTLKVVSKRESAVPVEVYGPKFFETNPSASVFESLQNINGVRPQLNCNVCNTGDIRINGQEGANTMMLIDGLPIVSGLSTVYGLSGIPQSLVDQLEVVKGPASTIYGSEAIGGVINLITKTPDRSPAFSVESFSSSWGESNTDLGARYYLSDNSAGLLGINYFNYTNPIDNNGDNFTDLTLQNRISIFNKLDLNKFSIATRYLHEDRWGGEMDWTPAYRAGSERYGESIYTSRWEVFGAYTFSPQAYIQYSFNDHDQNSAYGDTVFLAQQRIGFIQAVIDQNIGSVPLTLGVAYRYTWYNDNTPATASSDQTHLPGIFVQTTLDSGPNLQWLLGTRWDYNSRYGTIITPRLNIKLTRSSSEVFRFGFGSGYRVVNVFTEDHAALTGARDVVFVGSLNPERSWNANLNWTKDIYAKQGYILNVDASLFYTYFNNKILPNYDIDPQKIIYANLDGHAVNQGATLNLRGVFPNGIRFNAGATWIDAYTEENDVRIRPVFTERFLGTYQLTYSSRSGNSEWDFTGNTVSPMQLPLQENDTRDPNSDWMHLLNIQYTHRWGAFEVFGGFKNLLDFTPPADSIASADNPFSDEFDPTYVYASNQGRRMFMGVRWQLN